MAESVDAEIDFEIANGLWRRSSGQMLRFAGRWQTISPINAAAAIEMPSS
jgi:hypothetical protein